MVKDKLLLLDGQEVESVCPECSPAPPKLVIRTNRRTGNQFLGCPNWPRCFYTCEIPEYLKLKAAGQPMLF